jgi:hypothetical protein
MLSAGVSVISAPKSALCRMITTVLTTSRILPAIPSSLAVPTASFSGKKERNINKAVISNRQKQRERRAVPTIEAVSLPPTQSPSWAEKVVNVETTLNAIPKMADKRRRGFGLRMVAYSR